MRTEYLTRGNEHRRSLLSISHSKENIINWEFSNIEHLELMHVLVLVVRPFCQEHESAQKELGHQLPFLGSVPELQTENLPLVEN